MAEVRVALLMVFPASAWGGACVAAKPPLPLPLRFKNVPVLRKYLLGIDFVHHQTEITTACHRKRDGKVFGIEGGLRLGGGAQQCSPGSRLVHGHADGREYRSRRRQKVVERPLVAFGDVARKSRTFWVSSW